MDFKKNNHPQLCLPRECCLNSLFLKEKLNTLILMKVAGTPTLESKILNYGSDQPQRSSNLSHIDLDKLLRRVKMPLSLFIFLTQPEVEFPPFGFQQNKPRVTLHSADWPPSLLCCSLSGEATVAH